MFKMKPVKPHAPKFYKKDVKFGIVSENETTAILKKKYLSSIHACKIILFLRSWICQVDLLLEICQIITRVIIADQPNDK